MLWYSLLYALPFPSPDSQSLGHPPPPVHSHFHCLCSEILSPPSRAPHPDGKNLNFPDWMLAGQSVCIVSDSSFGKIWRTFYRQAQHNAPSPLRLTPRENIIEAAGAETAARLSTTVVENTFLTGCISPLGTDCYNGKWEIFWDHPVKEYTRDPTHLGLTSHFTLNFWCNPSH